MASKKRIGKYVIYLSNQLGRGSYSDVYLGVDEETKEEVAVKVLRKDKIMEDEYTKNAFQSQIQLNKKLKSPNIIKLYDVHETLNNFYIILELAKNGNLRSYLYKAGRFDERTTMKCLLQILNAFGELSKHGVTHRDLKPQNILIKDDVLKIADFGFAKQYEQKGCSLKTMVGTPAYMAPQILSQKRYTYKCDIWSLGVMTYEMIVGQIPWKFTDKTIEGYYNEIVTRKIVFPPQLEVSDNMKEFILGCICIDENKRLDWEQIFLHPLFEGRYDKHFQGKKEGQTQINFIMSNLRLNIHSKNINLKRMLSRFETGITKADFLNLIAKISREISKEEAELLYQFVAKEEGSVCVDKFTEVLVKYQCRLTGVDLSKKRMESEENSNMKSSKPGIDAFGKLKDSIDSKNLNIYQALEPKRFKNEEPLDLAGFAKLIYLIEPSMKEQEVGFLFKEFDTDGDQRVSFGEAYQGICKIAQIVPMEEQ